MPIARIAIENYLNRNLESKAWLKSLTAKQVEEDLSYIDPPPKFTIPTFRLDQKICFLVGIAYPELLVMADLGLGKTGVALELFSYYFHNGLIKRAFAFTPTNEVAEGWVDEIVKWGFNIPYIKLTQTNSKAKWEALEKFGDGLVIGTFVGIASMASELTEKRGRKSKKREPKKELLERLFDGTNAVWYDQSTRIGRSTTLSFKVCDYLTSKAKIRFGLAGRAFGRDPFILWSQLYLIDRGRALGENPWFFRQSFWRPVKKPWATEWVFKNKLEPVLANFVAHSSISYSVDECVDLPGKVLVTKNCEFADENWQYYDEIKKELIQARGNFREVKNAFLRLRQISSGFIGFIDDETEERAQIEFENNPKLDLLMQTIEEIPENRKLIIVHEYNWTGSRICQELTKNKYQFGWLWGGTKNWTEIKDKFNNDPNFRILVINSKKGSMGLNLQAASYMAIFESPVSAIDRYEIEGRIYRTGQLHKCFIIDLVMRDSVDEAILNFHKTGEDLWKNLVADPQKIIG